MTGYRKLTKEVEKQGGTVVCLEQVRNPFRKQKDEDGNQTPLYLYKVLFYNSEGVLTDFAIVEDLGNGEVEVYSVDGGHRLSECVKGLLTPNKTPVRG